MAFNEEAFRNERDQAKRNDLRPAAWREEDEIILNEEDLETALLNPDDRKPVREGEPMGGQKFGEGNNTSSANDKNNPSQYAGNTNPYFDRTEPMEEHPENSNFKDPLQAGSPDYDSAQPTSSSESQEPKPEKVERGNGDNDRPHKGDTGQEQASNSDDDYNIPGPNELPDQQKVGEDDERDHIET
jgi:hypothetical protein